VKIFYNPDEAIDIPNPVVTTGSFDGVHIGHKVILNRLKALAHQTSGESVLITFHPHPRKVLYPETYGRDLLLINSQKEKLELLESTGLDNLIIINFTLEFSRISSLDFIRNILVKNINAKKVVVGFNHYFGHNREGNFDHLYELGKYYGFDVEEIPEQDIHNETISSTRIRKAISEGYIQKANAYLDHHYHITGKLTNDENLFSNAGFPGYSLSIEEECKLIPPGGLYAISVMIEGKRHKGLAGIDNTANPINSCNQKEIAVSILGIDKLPDGYNARIEFAQKMKDLPFKEKSENLRIHYIQTCEEVQELIY